MNVRRLLTSAVLLLAVPLSSCASVSFDAQTDQVYNPAVGVDNRSGSVDVLNALVVSGSEGSGTVVATLVANDQGRGDTLRGVAGAGSDSSLQVTPGGKTTIPSGGLLNLATDGRIAVRGEKVAPGNFVRLTFSFERGEAVTVLAPVVSADNPDYSSVPLPSAT